MLKFFLIVSFLFIFISGFGFAENNFIGHLTTIPIIEGTGIYSTVSAFIYSDNVFTRVSSITCLSVLSTNVILGIVNAITIRKKESKIRLIHRIVGYINVASAIVFNVASSIDEQLDNKPTRYVGYAYTTWSTIPIFTFRF